MTIHSLEYEPGRTRRYRWAARRESLEALAVVAFFLLAGTAAFYFVASVFIARLSRWGMGPG
jgi:hypothetical protein